MDVKQQTLRTRMGQTYTRNGSGPALILLHGWPFHRASFRRLIPLLASRYTCYAIDSAGMGESGLAEDNDYSFAGHARRVMDLVDELDLPTFALLEHDTGGTIARLVAAGRPDQVRQLILMDTEVPGHIPPVVPRFQRLMRFGVMRQMFRWLLHSKAFGRSRYGFGECFHDPDNMTDEFLALFSFHWIESPQRLEGLIAYLMGIDHKEIDDLNQTHSKIQAPTLIIWGRHDSIFPLALAKNLVGNMPSCTHFEVVDDAGFLVHEEKPDQVAKAILDFPGAHVSELPTNAHQKPPHPGATASLR